jgi:hypothetical protein
MCGPPQRYVDQFLRKMGEHAALKGKLVESCVLRGFDRATWLRGYSEGLKEKRESEHKITYLRGG